VVVQKIKEALKQEGDIQVCAFVLSATLKGKALDAQETYCENVAEAASCPELASFANVFRPLFNNPEISDFEAACKHGVKLMQ